MPRVYLPHPIMQRDADGQLKPKFNMDRLNEIGRVKYLLAWEELALRPDRITIILRQRLREYNDEDWLVMAGHPAISALSLTIAVEMNRGKVNMLYWDRKREDFAKFPIDHYNFIQEAS